MSFVFILTGFGFNVGTPKADAVTVTDSNLTLAFEAGNGWNDGTASYQQISCTLSSGNAGVITDWKVSFQFSAGAQVNQGWCGEYSVDDAGLLTVEPSDSNATIQKSSSTTFGFIVKNPGTFKEDCAAIVSYKLNGKEVTGEPEVPAVSEEPTPVPSAAVSKEPAVSTVPSQKPSAKPSGSGDWLFTDGNRVIDKNGNQVWLTGCNWFGYNTGTNCFDGIWACDLNKALEGIADRGFNLLRIPISSELCLNWEDGIYPKPCYNDFVNNYLAGMNSLEIFDYVIKKCDQLGIKIMMDIHSAETDASGHYAPLWYTEKISEADYLESLSWLADRYKDDDTIIAYDLENEPHGKAQETKRAIWNGTKDPNNWKYIAEKAAAAVLSKNPNALIMVEGIEIYPKDLENNSDYHSTNAKEYYGTWWGGNLRGVKDFPVDLGKFQNKLVYSPHDYGPGVFEQDWFKGDYTLQSLYDDCWGDNWMYIHDDNIAPILIGEWGGYMSQPNLKWMTLLRELIIKNKLNHTFWCYNANSGDTGGLVGYDFITWDEDKYEFVKEALWQEGGKFVGLSQDTKLGKNGTCVGEVFK
jgi:aryl-phospho-beta-D-glucosidase BglC (GH1 family)